uniref:Uncharacterized protein n=1 Tax=Panagrolaimus sp. ES5 TaxID=591445 RepID=A0AC34GEN0_9BILA
MDTITMPKPGNFLEDLPMLYGFPVDVKCFRNPIQRSLVNSFSSLSLNSSADEIEKRMRQLKMYNAELFPELLSMDDYCRDLAAHVYPALMNKQIVSFLRDQTYDSEMLVVAFANLLRTYRYACSRYPQVQEINDKHVLQFCANERYRTKEWTNDLGELLFKMAAVDKSQHPQCSFNNAETKR